MSEPWGWDDWCKAQPTWTWDERVPRQEIAYPSSPGPLAARLPSWTEEHSVSLRRVRGEAIGPLRAQRDGES